MVCFQNGKLVFLLIIRFQALHNRFPVLLSAPESIWLKFPKFIKILNNIELKPLRLGNYKDNKRNTEKPNGSHKDFYGKQAYANPRGLKKSKLGRYLLECFNDNLHFVF